MPSPSVCAAAPMAATGPEDRAGAGPDGTAACPVGRQACVSKTKQGSNGPGVQHALVYGQSCVQAESGRYKSNLAAPLPVGPTMHLVTAQAPYSFRSPESVEMDEIMAAMVLTSLSCSPVVQSSPQTDPGPAGSSSSPADMECAGGELSDSGSSGYWSWDHGNVSPAPSPSVTEMDSSPDEGLHMELEQGEELAAKKTKELRQKCVQMPVAQLWQSPHVFSRHKKTHPCAASGWVRPVPARGGLLLHQDIL